MLQHQKLCRDSISMQLLQIGVVTQFLCRDSIFVGSCCNNVSCIFSISVEIRKVCRDRVLSPLNLISYCSFLLILRHSLLVLSMFSVATQFLCCDRTFLYSTYIYIATHFVMSRQDLSSLCWNLYRDIEKSVATLFINVQLIFLSRP